MTVSSPARPRVLVVEDEYLLAMEIEEAVRALGGEVVGPVAKLDDGLALASHETFDCAILDVNIRGGNVYPLADMLLERGLPVVLASGYSDWMLPQNLQGQQRLVKPFTSLQLQAEIRGLLARAQSGSETQ